MPTLAQITHSLEQWAPLSLQEPYDNAGLQYGIWETEVQRVLTTLDVTEEVVEEAISLGCELIVSHHPLLFKPLKQLSDRDAVGRILMKAVRHNIALYAAHTNLDAVHTGVNRMLAEMLGLEQIQTLSPKAQSLLKLEVMVPGTHSLALRNALGAAGAGHIGLYKHCSFRHIGVGTFTPTEGASPAIGSVGKAEEVEEEKIEVLVPKTLQNQILSAMRSAHPYEEIAFYLYELLNKDQEIGIGMKGEWTETHTWQEVADRIVSALDIPQLAHNNPHKTHFKKVAVCGGSGSFLIKPSIIAGVDLLLTSDLKYHDWFDAEGLLTVVDVGHFASETHTRLLLQRFLSEKFPNIAVNFSKTFTNPVRIHTR
jgi:dinuclear metal center YbgI/SA1388 family protein